MAVQAAAVVEAGEQVLADGGHVEHVAAGQVVLDQARVPQLAADQEVPGERRTQPLAGEVHRVAFRHARR